LNANNILPVLIFSQFACTSLWFAGNAVLSGMAADLQLPAAALGHLVSAVQVGFIGGTLFFALFTVADRFSPSRLFFWCALAGAATNAGAFLAEGFTGLVLSRGLTGFCLAGIYPVGMKIAADYHRQGLGLALGLLVGALVLGTAFPHLLHYLTANLSWEYVIGLTSGLALLGGTLMVVLVPDGPYQTKGAAFHMLACVQVFRDQRFRAAAFGYFGHMWELYTFWAFVPLLLRSYSRLPPGAAGNPALLSFFIIGSGAVACWLGGYLAQHIGSARTAFGALGVSGMLCLLSPLLFHLPFPAFLFCLLVWGMAVVMDSPQFSTLVAQNAPPGARGTALTIVNCLGFFITIVSIQVFRVLADYLPAGFQYQLLAIGPFLGLWAMRRAVFIKNKQDKPNK
jgi:predicted MFS family arabinose efflux permease